MGALGLNTTDNEATANQILGLTVQHRNALDNLINAKKTVGEPSPAPANSLNLTNFDIRLDDGGKMKGLGKEICDIYQGPDALSHYLIKRLQTQRVQTRAETLPPMLVNEDDDMVDIFEEWAVTVHRCQPDEQGKKDVL